MLDLSVNSVRRIYTKASAFSFFLSPTPREPGVAVGAGEDLFVITVGFSLPTRPTVLSIHRLRPGLAPRSPSCPVFMSLRRGQYFSVEPSHRDPLYKTLTKNRRSNPCPAPSPPLRLPHACPQRSGTQLQFAGRQACQIGQISKLWGPGELLSSPGVLK